MSRSPLARRLGYLIRARRTGRGMTQPQLAATLGVRQTCISKWELGWTSPTAPQLVRLMLLLGITAEDLDGPDVRVEPVAS